MKKRMLLMLAAVAAFLAVIGSVKFLQVRSAMAQQSSFQPPPEAVTTVIAKPEEWKTVLKAVGTVVAVNGVTVSADTSGVVAQILFDSGRSVNSGDVLVRLDTKQERAQLAAAEAQRELARLDLDRKRKLLSESVLSQDMYDSTEATFKQADAKVAELTATIERKTIRAPFSGVLGIRQVNLGQHLAEGAPVVSLQSLRPAYVRFTVPEQELLRLRSGSDVTAISDAMSGSETGRITAFDSIIDESTRNVMVQATFDNRSGKLRPGMFVQAVIASGKNASLIAIPASSVSYAPFGDSVFIVEDVKGPNGKTYRGVRQQFVKLGETRGDQVTVLSGIKPGEEVVTSGVFKLRPGVAVTVNNAIQPANSSTPRPEEG